MDKFSQWWALDDLRKKLMYVKYDNLDLKYLESLRSEVATKEAEARIVAFGKEQTADAEVHGND